MFVCVCVCVCDLFGLIWLLGSWGQFDWTQQQQVRLGREERVIIQCDAMSFKAIWFWFCFWFQLNKHSHTFHVHLLLSLYAFTFVFVFAFAAIRRRWPQFTCARRSEHAPRAMAANPKRRHIWSERASVWVKRVRASERASEVSEWACEQMSEGE